MKELELLIKKAREAQEKSYSPYSSFRVGCAILLKDGNIISGANIENASYTPTICAERVAFFQAVHEGHLNFTAIAIVGGSKGSPIESFCTPCGVCRQVMSEFCKGDFKIILSDGKENSIFTLDDMLPHRFVL